MKPGSKLQDFFNFTITQTECILCGNLCEKKWCLCNDCRAELPYIEHSCNKCSAPLKLQDDLCGQCLSQPPANHRAISVLHYESPVDHLIKKMKYHNQLEIADLMGRLLVQKLKASNESLPELIIPVPLHASRLSQRGYNQATEIGRSVSKALNIPMNITDCVRSRTTQPQFELSIQERKSNIKNAFEVIATISAKHVAILDDVMTTGSTVNELTATLLKSGVEKVDIWTCSRATLN